MSRSAIAYIRQSQSRTDQDESLSLSFQERRIRDYADRTGLEIVDVYSDLDVSGNVESRKGLDAMLARCDQGGIEVVAIYNISRLARDTLLFLKICKDLQRRKITLVSASESMEDRTVVTVLSAFAERERIQLSNTIAFAVRESARRGRITQGPPYGYRQANGNIEVVPTEAAIVQRIFRAYVSGQTSGEILDALHRDHIPTATGLPTWQRSSVTRMLRNRAYNGEISIAESRDPIGRVRPALLTFGNHEAIVDRDTFDAAQTILRGERAIRRLTTFPAPWLAGAMRCSACGDRLYLEVMRHKPERLQPYWIVRCAANRKGANTSKPSTCDGQPISVYPPIDAAARRSLADDLTGLVDPESAFAAALADTGHDHQRRGAELRAIIAETDERLARLWLAAESGDIPMDLHRQRRVILQERHDAAAAELATVPVLPEIAAFAAAHAVALDHADIIQHGASDDLREIITIMGATAIVDVRAKSVTWRYGPRFAWLIPAR